jgi:hypothetical protein
MIWENVSGKILFRNEGEACTRKLMIGGADGIRTHDLLDAIEARSQLRHGPTELPKFTIGLLTTAGLRHALP